MKKKWFQRGLCAALTATLALGLTGCGGKKGVSQDPSLAKQYVYSCREIEELTNLGDDFSMYDVARKDGRLYFLASIYNYSAGYEQNVKIVSVKEDGTDFKIADLEMPVDDKDDENGDDVGTDTGNGGSSGADVGIMPLSSRQRVMIGASSASVEAVAPAETAEDTEASENEGTTEDEGNSEGAATDVEEPDGLYDPYGQLDEVYENTNYGPYLFSYDTDLVYAVKTHRIDNYKDPQNPISQIDRALCAWDMEGKLLWEKDMEEYFPNQEEYYPNRLIAQADGTLLIMVEGTSFIHVVLDRDGNLVKSKEVERDDILDFVNEYIIKDDGTAAVLYWNKEWTEMYYAPYDFETGKVGEGQKLPGNMAAMGYNAVIAGIDTDLVLTNSYGVFTYNLGDEELTQIMSYVNSDLNTNTMNQIMMLDETHFVACYNETEDYTSRCGYFTKVNPEDIPDKEVVLIAGSWLNSDLKKRVVDFNKSNDKYRIIVKEYDTYATQDDYMAGYTQLNNDIVSGNMPDILVCDANMPVENYISKGLLADVGKLIENDEELSKEQFVENAFNAYKVKDKLYYVIPSFNVRTVIGKKSILGDRTSWTMKEFQELLDTLPEGTMGFGEMTRESFIYTMLYYCGSDFVDISTGKCNFDSENFINMLEYANTLPETIDYSQWDEDYWMNYQSQWRDGRTLLQELYINSMRGVNQSTNGSFGEEVTFVGFPTDSGKGSTIGLNYYYAISSKSANQEGAWEFLRYYLTQEYQDDLTYQIPTNRSSYQKWLAQGMQKPYYEDMDGTKVEYDDTYYINGEEIVLPVLTQEETDRISAFIESVDKPTYMNQEIQNIIAEEAAAYFAGQKSVKDVADIIQSRVRVYVNENR